MRGAYYNEIDHGAAAWLRELIAGGHIAPGDVDERSIADVQPDDLRGYTQAHFFAGIGGWSLALRLGGWPDDRPVWTGSCPCQPFSAAGKRRGTADERHLWPEFRRLIGECRPPVAFGEQVASKAGRDWLAAVRADLEALGYAVGAADLCSAGVGAPNIRQRGWWVADTHGWHAGAERQQRGGQYGQQPQDGLAGDRLAHAHADRRAAVPVPGLHHAEPHAQPCRSPGVGLADASCPRLEIVGEQHARAERAPAERGGEAGDRLAHAAEPGRHEQPLRADRTDGRPTAEPGRLRVAGFWEDADWLPCRDGKARPVEPGSFPLAHGVPGRVGLLRGYGNAINPYVAAEFIAAFDEARAGVTA